MKRSLAITLCVLAGVAGLSGGYVLRVNSHRTAHSAKGAPAESGAKTKSVAKSSHRESSHASRVKDRVERSEGAHHWLQWMSGVESASLADLPGLARMARDNSGALRMIAYRWLELDPQHFLETIQRESVHADDRDGFPAQEMARYLFEEWPKRDAEAAIAALKIPGALVGLRHSVLDTVFRNDPRRGLELMNEWSIFHFGPNTDGLKKWARREPQAAAQATLDHPVGFGAEYSMQAIAKVWAERDPQAALEFALQSPGKLGRTLRDQVLTEWAGVDRVGAADWLAGQEDEKLRAQLSPLIVEAWAKEDPQAALAWCEDNLEGHRLVAAVSKLAEGAAARDPQAAAKLVAGMEASPARTQAAIALGQKWFPQSYPSNQGVKPEAVDWIRNLGDLELQGQVLEKIAWGWGMQDRESLMQVLSESAGDHVPQSVYNVVMRSLTVENPLRALEWASQLPEKRAPDAAINAFSIWTQHRPEEALNWLVDLPANDTRRPGLVRNLVTNLSFQLDAGVAAERLGKLAPSDHLIAREEIERAGIPLEKKERLLGALKK